MGSRLASKYLARVEIIAVANILAYYDAATITAVKSFIVQAPGLTRKQNGRLEMLAWDKHSSLFDPALEMVIWLNYYNYRDKKTKWCLNN